MATSLSDIARKTQDIYERNAARFDKERSKTLFEKNWIDRFLSFLPEAGHVLDLGCGSGDPIGGYFLSKGYRLIGADASAAMLEIAKTRFPNGDWRYMDMRHLDMPERFYGIIGWDSFFHLTGDEQRNVLSKLAAHLRPTGVLLLTVGPEEGEVTGHVGDDVVYHASLSFEEYHSILVLHGMDVIDFVPEDPDCGFHTILLAQKKPVKANS